MDNPIPDLCSLVPEPSSIHAPPGQPVESAGRSFSVRWWEVTVVACSHHLILQGGSRELVRAILFREGNSNRWPHDRVCGLEGQTGLGRLGLVIQSIAMAMDSTGLALKWGESGEIMKRVAEGKLLHFPTADSWCKPSRDNTKSNRCVLMPCLEMLGHVPNYHLPHLDPMKNEIDQLFTSGNKQLSEKECYKTAISIKKLLGFVKRRVNHKEVTKDIGNHKQFHFHISIF